MSYIIFVRHGSTDHATNGIYQGHLNNELNPKGISEMRITAQMLYKNFDTPKAIYCSDLRRVSQSAKVIGEQFNVKIKKTTKLRELDCGTWTGKSLDDVKRLYPNEILDMYSGRDFKRGGAESLDDLRARSSDFLIKLNPLLDIIIVSHAYSIRELIDLKFGIRCPLLKPGAYAAFEFMGDVLQTIDFCSPSYPETSSFTSGHLL